MYHIYHLKFNLVYQLENLSLISKDFFFIQSNIGVQHPCIISKTDSFTDNKMDCALESTPEIDYNS